MVLESSFSQNKVRSLLKLYHKDLTQVNINGAIKILKIKINVYLILVVGNPFNMWVIIFFDIILSLCVYI